MNTINYNPEKSSIVLQQEEGQLFSEKGCKKDPQSKISSLGSQILENNQFQQNQQLSPTPQPLLTPSTIKVYEKAMVRQKKLEKAITKLVELEYKGGSIQDFFKKERIALDDVDKAVARARGIIYKPTDRGLRTNWNPTYGKALPDEKQIPFKLTYHALCLIEAIPMGEIPPRKYHPITGDFYEYCDYVTPPFRENY